MTSTIYIGSEIWIERSRLEVEVVAFLFSCSRRPSFALFCCDCENILQHDDNRVLLHHLPPGGAAGVRPRSGGNCPGADARAGGAVVLTGEKKERTPVA